MHFDADMMGDEADDPLGVGGRNAAAGVFQSARQPVDPEPAIGIEHHLDDAGVFEIAGDRRSQRGAQHARAAGEGLGPEGRLSTLRAPQTRLVEADGSAGSIRKSRKRASATSLMGS